VEAVVRGNDVRVPSFGAVGHDTVQLARSRWLDQLEAGLTPRWAEYLAASLPGVPRLAKELDASLAQVGTHAVPSRAAGAVKAAAIVTGLAALTGVAVIAGHVLMEVASGRGVVWPA